ncbi:superoxide dismutase [Candidatus Berkelbacteria bacterium]|nr:superoxide dismutase [Candidatus Berkelbacteria bacterium]
MAFELPKLPYAYDALEPVIDAQTMELHHTKHHQAYIDKLNKALEGHEAHAPKTIEELLRRITEVPEEIRTAVRNHGGGHANHSLFWEIMAPNAGGEPSGELASTISQAFGSFDEFKAKFSDAAINQFGSGWAWLVKKPDGSLAVYAKPNQDSPLMDGDTPLLGLDVWEHAYYLKYQNKRADYVSAWWQLVNWPNVAERYSA